MSCTLERRVTPSDGELGVVMTCYALPRCVTPYDDGLHVVMFRHFA